MRGIYGEWWGTRPFCTLEADLEGDFLDTRDVLSALSILNSGGGVLGAESPSPWKKIINKFKEFTL